MAHRHGDGGASGAVYGTAAAAVIGGLIALPVIQIAARLYWLLWPVTVPATLFYLAFGAFGDETTILWWTLKLHAVIWMKETAFLALTGPVGFALHRPVFSMLLAPVIGWCGLYAFFWLRLNIGRVMRRRRLARI
jgi:hypothetical protein